MPIVGPFLLIISVSRTPPYLNIQLCAVIPQFTKIQRHRLQSWIFEWGLVIGTEIFSKKSLTIVIVSLSFQNWLIIYFFSLAFLFVTFCFFKLLIGMVFYFLLKLYSCELDPSSIYHSVLLWRQKPPAEFIFISPFLENQFEWKTPLCGKNFKVTLVLLFPLLRAYHSPSRFPSNPNSILSNFVAIQIGKRRSDSSKTRYILQLYLRLTRVTSWRLWNPPLSLFSSVSLYRKRSEPPVKPEHWGMFQYLFGPW